MSSEMSMAADSLVAVVAIVVVSVFDSTIELLSNAVCAIATGTVVAPIQKSVTARPPAAAMDRIDCSQAWGCILLVWSLRFVDSSFAVDLARNEVIVDSKLPFCCSFSTEWCSPDSVFCRLLLEDQQWFR